MTKTTKSIRLEISTELHADLKAAAALERISLAAFIAKRLNGVVWQHRLNKSKGQSK